MRRDLQPLQEWDEIAVDLKILTARRYDLAADGTAPSTGCEHSSWSISLPWNGPSTTPHPKPPSSC